MESLNCIIETPKGSNAKYDYDPKLGTFEINKIMPVGLMFPFDFGFLPGTIGEDGDPLDVVVISEITLFPGCSTKCRVVGAIKAVQRERGGKRVRNDRYIVIPEVSVIYKKIRDAKQLPEQVLTELQNFFINYNRQAGKEFKPISLLPSNKAIKTIKKAQKEPEPDKLIQLLLPLSDNKGTPFPQHYYSTILKKLIKEFGGATAYSQAPISGLWEDDSNKVVKDKLIIYEVMAGKIDRTFWDAFKKQLEKKFKQREIVIRQTQVGLL